eukprot:13758-Heterococcus_DN1.PRE.1
MACTCIVCACAAAAYEVWQLSAAIHTVSASTHTISTAVYIPLTPQRNEQSPVDRQSAVLVHTVIKRLSAMPQ